MSNADTVYPHITYHLRRVRSMVSRQNRRRSDRRVTFDCGALRGSGNENSTVSSIKNFGIGRNVCQTSTGNRNAVRPAIGVEEPLPRAILGSTAGRWGLKQRGRCVFPQLLKRWQTASRLTLSRPRNFASMDPGIYGHLTLCNLAAIARERGDALEAERQWKAVPAECPGDKDAVWRPEGLLPLPLPSRGGSIDLLRPYVNLSDDGFRAMIAWLTAALRPVGPYPILSLHGEQGSAKSTLARRMMRFARPLVRPGLDVLSERRFWTLPAERGPSSLRRPIARVSRNPLPRHFLRVRHHEHATSLRSLGIAGGAFGHAFGHARGERAGGPWSWWRWWSRRRSCLPGAAGFCGAGGSFKAPRMARIKSPARTSSAGTHSHTSQQLAMNTTGAGRRGMVGTVNPGSTTSAGKVNAASLSGTGTAVAGRGNPLTGGTVAGATSTNPGGLYGNGYTYGYGPRARQYRAYGYGSGYRNRYYGRGYGYGRSQGYNRAIVGRLRSA